VGLHSIVNELLKIWSRSCWPGRCRSPNGCK